MPIVSPYHRCRFPNLEYLIRRPLLHFNPMIIICSLIFYIEGHILTSAIFNNTIFEF